MNVEEKVKIVESVAEEIITKDELRKLFEEKKHPVAYDGFEPSGLAHLPFGIFRPLILEKLMSTGIRFKLYLADWFAWINNKLGGNLEAIRKCGEYFVEVWRAAGVDLDKVEIVWASDFVTRKEYWQRVLTVAKHCTVARAERALTIMGRKKGELKEVAQYFYPMMQVADIFEIDVDICQLGLDQRRANMLARDIAEKLKWQKPVVVSHHMLLGLAGLKEPEGFDENKRIDAMISSKMSKSKPSTCIFVHDSEEEIRKKISKAFCPAKQVEGNPILEYCKYIIFPKFRRIKIEREKKYGGDLEVDNYEELKALFKKGELHPLDLKNAVAFYLNELIEPIREHFEKNKRARELYETVKKAKVTR